MLPRLFALNSFSLLVAACGGSTEAAPAFGDRSIVVESYNNCANVSLADEGGAKTLILEQACHGWSVHQCGATSVFIRKGVVADLGIFTYPHNQRSELNSQINVELGRERDEYLHLQFIEPNCTRNGIELRFSGSRIGVGQSGSADDLSGTVAMHDDGSIVVSVES